MDFEPGTEQERGDSLNTTTVSDDRPVAASRNRWMAIGLIAFALVAVVFAISVFGVQRLNMRRADDLAKSGKAAFATGDFARAESDLASSVELRSADSTSQALLGRTREGRGDLAGAAAAYAASLSTQPDQPELLCKVAMIKKSQGANAEAIAALKKALAADKNFFPAHLLLAQIYIDAGDGVQARAELDAVIKLRPTGVDLKELKKRRDALQ